MAFVSLVSHTKRGMDRPQSVSRLELSAHASRTLVQAEGWGRRIRGRLRVTPSGSLARIGGSTSRAFGRSDDCSLEWSSVFLERNKKQKGEALKPFCYNDSEWSAVNLEVRVNLGGQMTIGGAWMPLAPPAFSRRRQGSYS